MNGTFKRDDDNMRVKGYISDTQGFTPPSLSEKATFLTSHRGLSHYRAPI